MARLDRLRAMTRQELRWRARVALRTGRHFLRARVRLPRWDRRDLPRVLSPGVLDPEMRSAIRHEQWHALHETIRERLHARGARFVLDPASRERVREAVRSRWPAAAQQAADHANRMLKGEHDVLGYRGLSFARDGGVIDWHLDPVHNRRAPQAFYAQVPYLDPAIGDHKIIWEINRHQHWLRLGRAAWLTGDARYARAILEDLESWLAVNPPLIGINWASMLEIGFRTLSWTWAAHCLLGMHDLHGGTPNPGTPNPHQEHGNPEPGTRNREPASPWLIDILIGLHHQLTHVEQNLSYYFSPNTHLTGEALALYVAGTAFPELAASGRWAETGRRVLLAEIERQILPDGGHAERSTHYQRYTLDFYLLAWLTARHQGDVEAESRFAGAAARLADFTRVIADDEGRLPLIGDDDGGMLWPLTGRECHDVRDSLAVAASMLDQPHLAPWGVAEEAVWIAGPEAAIRPGVRAAQPATVIGSRALVETGYVVLRDGRGAHAVLDAGAHGYLNGGHAHADALALTLSLGGRPLLVDPGTSTYTSDPALRDRMRSSMCHNTITVDGRSQSTPAGPFHWHTRAHARLLEWRHNPGFDWAEASHDGYAPLEHRRTLLRAGEGGWLVADEILGSGLHAAAAHWHFDPSWMLRAMPGRLHASHITGARAWLLHDSGRAALFHGDETAGLGWYAPVYGTLVPAWTARITAEGLAPMALVTWIGDGADWTAPSLARLAAEGDPQNRPIAAQIADGPRRAVFMLRPGGPAPHAARTCRVRDYETDARVLHYTAEADRLCTLALVEARRLVSPRPGWLSIEADAPMSDLFVSLSARALDLRATVPPAGLRIRVGNPFHFVRLNGRELPLEGVARPEGFRVERAEWRDAAGVSAPARPWRGPGAAFARQ